MRADIAKKAENRRSPANSLPLHIPCRLEHLLFRWLYDMLDDEDLHRPALRLKFES